MMISTKGRYALRVMLDLAEHRDEGYVAMKSVAQRQNLSLKYLEKIMPDLVKSHYVKGVHGKGGGYRLEKEPSEYRVGDILRLAEGDLAPVACLQCDAEVCERSGDCKTLPMWKEFHALTNAFFDGLTLEDVMRNGTTV